LKAAVLRKPNRFSVEELETPSPSSGEVLVRVKACGICGSDVVRLKKGATVMPIALGHEFSGEVAAVGRGVKRWREGDRVVGLPLIPCFRCAPCRNGWYSLCERYSFLGSRRNGAMAEFCLVPEGNLMRLQGDISFEDGALIEPATVPLYALLMLPASERRGCVVILGLGTIGLFALQWARLMGMEPIIAVDIRPELTRLARKLGADAVLDASRRDVVRETMRLTRNQGAHIVMETAGAPSSQVRAWEIVGKRGFILQVGTAHRDVIFPAKTFETLLRREVTVRGSWMSYSRPFPGRAWFEARKNFASGGVTPRVVVSHRITLDEVPRAMRDLARGRLSGKVLILFD